MKSKFSTNSNVLIRTTNLDTSEQHIYQASNRVSLDLLYGISKYLLQNPSNRYTPQYILFGSSSDPNPSDTADLTPNPNEGYNPNFYEKFRKTNIIRDQTGVENSDKEKWICVFTAHVPIGYYIGTSSDPTDPLPLCEIGLFSDTDVLLARAVIDPEITQDSNTVIDVEWKLIFESIADQEEEV